MRKGRIIAFVLFVALSFTVVKALGGERQYAASGQLATVSEIASSSESALASNNDPAMQLPELSAQGSFASANIAAASTSSQCGADVGARLGIVRFLNSDVNVFDRNGDSRWPIASITKLMTAIVVAEHGDLARQVVITGDMLVEAKDSAGLQEGQMMTESDLLKAMLSVSSNAAAEALAQTYGRDAFIKLMNDKAGELRMLNTSYFDPSGLTPKNQSTPDDLYRLMDYLHIAHPELLTITRQRRVVITDLHAHKKHTLTNIDTFAGQNNFVGGKTGYIPEAEGNGNLITLFTVHNQPVVIGVFGSPDRFGETKKLLQCI